MRWEIGFVALAWPQPGAAAIAGPAVKMMEAADVLYRCVVLGPALAVVGATWTPAGLNTGTRERESVDASDAWDCWGWSAVIRDQSIDGPARYGIWDLSTHDSSPR